MDDAELSREQMADDAEAAQMLRRARAITREVTGAMDCETVCAVFQRLAGAADRRAWVRAELLGGASYELQ